MHNFSLNLLTFPLWWYTVGLRLVWQRAKLEFHYGLHQTGLLVFARHLKEPLYGDYTRSGKVIGFFLRVLLLAFKLVVFVLRLLMIVFLGLCYLLLLPAVCAMIIMQILPLG